MTDWQPYHYQCCEPNCPRDGKPIDERHETVWNKVVGWEKKRDQGGTNHIALRRPLPEYRCSVCMELLLNGCSPGQQTLV